MRGISPAFNRRLLYTKTIGSKVVPNASFLQIAQEGSIVASGELYSIAYPSLASLICRSIAELQRMSPDPAPAAASLMNRLYNSVLLRSLYSSVIFGYRTLKSLRKVSTTAASVVE